MILPPQDLSASHSWEVFQFFLVNEYTKADSSLAELLTSQRDEESFRAHLLRFYLGDRLHLLRCLRHIVANTANPQHPYQVVTSLHYIQSIYVIVIYDTFHEVDSV